MARHIALGVQFALGHVHAFEFPLFLEALGLASTQIAGLIVQ
ncbi:hypothetical protein MCERH10_00936 [Caulobacteraceae bacterium]